MKLHLPKGIRQAILACITIAATAGTSAYGAGWDIPTIGDFYAGPFEFSFDYNTAATADTILASYCGKGEGGSSWCKFILGTDGTLKLVRTNGNGDALTSIGTIVNTSFFQDGGQNYTLTADTTYTVKYLGGGNGSAAADLYIGDEKVASFTQGSFNMNGSVSAPLLLNINASYNAGANAATWNATSGDSANIAYTNDGAWNISGGSCSQSGNFENQRPDVVFGAADNLVKNVTVSDVFMADGIAINDSYTFTGSDSALIDALSITVADGKTMTLAGTGAIKTGAVEGAVEIVKDATWAINSRTIDISTVTGEGNLAFDNGMTVLGYGQSSKLTGKLIIKTGGDLRLGLEENSANNGSVDLSSLSGGIELAGGTLSTRFLSGEIGDISVTADSVLNPVDIQSYSESGQTRLYQLGIGTLDMGANLTVKTGWKANIDVDHITGTGNLTFTNESGDSVGRDLYIGSVAGYTGKLIVDHVKENNGSDKTGGNVNTGRLHVTIGEGESLSADQLAVNTSNGSIELDGSGTFTVAADGSIAKGAWKTERTENSTTTVEDHTGEKGSFASTWTGTAELNGTTLNNANLNTYGNSGSKVKLQNVNGSIAAGEVAPTLVVAGDSSEIALTGDTTFTALTFEGGSLTATGDATLTLNAVSIDLTKYTTDALEHTLVSAGTLNLGANVDLSTLGGTVDGYTATVQKSGNSLVLTFALPDAGNSLLVEGAELDLDARVLALTVDGNLTGLSSVDLTLSDAALQEITGKYGDVSLELIADDGTFYTVGDTNVIGNVSFYNGAYVGEGNGMYKVEYIPEPATATLSLLALAGLAARRRRK